MTAVQIRVIQYDIEQLHRQPWKKVSCLGLGQHNSKRLSLLNYNKYFVSDLFNVYFCCPAALLCLTVTKIRIEISP